MIILGFLDACWIFGDLSLLGRLMDQGSEILINWLTSWTI
jgi:hypothetical protein